MEGVGNSVCVCVCVQHVLYNGGPIMVSKDVDEISNCQHTCINTNHC